MATLTFQHAKVLASGRVLRVRFAIRPEPADHGLPDSLPGWQAGLRLTLSNGGQCEPIGQISVNWDDYGAVYQFVTNAASTIAIGTYWVRMMIADGGGNEVKALDLTGEFGGVGETHKGLKVTATGKDIQFKFAAIPASHTGRLYASTENGLNQGAEHTLGLLVSGIAAGATTHTISQITTFENASQRPTLPRTWICYFLIPAASIVEYGDTVTFDAPAGLYVDEFGNQTGSVDDGAIENLSMMDANGFCTEDFGLSASGKIVYVSDTYGNDANDGTDITLPKKDLVTAWNTLPNRSGSKVRLLRGDTFPMTSSLGSRFGVTGARTTPLVMESYHHDYGQGADPNTRPILFHSNYVCNWHAGMTDYFENIIFRDLHFKGNGSGKIGPNWVVGASNILWTNCVFEGTQCGVGQAGNYYETLNATIHRCIVKDNWNPGGNYQGVYTAGARGLHIAECVVDRCGWKDAAFAERSIFDHNVYLQNNTHEVICWNLWTGRAGGVGFQQRGGGCMAHVIFYENGFQENVNRYGMSPYKCVVVNSAFECKALTTAEHSVETEAIGGTMDFCIAVNAQNNVGGSAFSQRQANDYSNGYRQRFLYSRARHCTAVDHGVSLVLGNGVFTGFCQVVNCVLKNTSATTDAVQVTLADSNNTNWIDSDNNAWHIAKSNGWWIDNQGVVTSNTFAAWQALGRDPNSIAATINMVDSTYDMGDHSAAEGGPSTTADFLTALRNRGRTTWSDLYSARAAYDNFSAAYAVTSLPAIDLTADGYYGHYDYRSGLPVFFTITGPDELELDELGTFTITPSGPPDATVQVSDDGAPSGTMNPQNVIWSAAEQDGRTFDYTPKDADGGSRTITADIAGDVVAIKVVTVTDPEEPPIPPPSGGLVSSAEWRW